MDPNRIENVLTNKKYKSDVLPLKKFTVDFLEPRLTKGKCCSYYVEGSHEC